MDTTILIANTTPLDIMKEKHLPSMTLLYKVHNIWGIDVITLKREERSLQLALLVAPSISTTNLVDLYGMKYVISVKPIEDGQRFELIYAGLEGLQGNRARSSRGEYHQVIQESDTDSESMASQKFQSYGFQGHAFKNDEQGFSSR